MYAVAARAAAGEDKDVADAAYAGVDDVLFRDDSDASDVDKAVPEVPRVEAGHPGDGGYAHPVPVVPDAVNNA